MFLSGRYPLMLRRFLRHMKVLPRQWFSILQTLWQSFVDIRAQNREFLASCCYVCNERHLQLHSYFIRTYSFLAYQRTSKLWFTIQYIQETFFYHPRVLSDYEGTGSSIPAMLCYFVVFLSNNSKPFQGSANFQKLFHGLCDEEHILNRPW